MFEQLFEQMFEQTMFETKNNARTQLNTISDKKNGTRVETQFRTVSLFPKLTKTCRFQNDIKLISMNNKYLEVLNLAVSELITCDGFIFVGKHLKHLKVLNVFTESFLKIGVWVPKWGANFSPL